MKKLFILSAMLIAGLTSSFAQSNYSARAYISMGDQPQELRLREKAADPTYSDFASDNNNVGVAAFVEGTRYITWGCSDLEGLQLAFIPTAANCTFSFANVIGDLYLIDALNGERKHIVAGESYSFEVAADLIGQNVVNRFSISKVGEVEPEICHEGQLLKVKNYNGVVKVDDDEYNVEGNLDIDLSNLSAGHHKVIWIDGQELIINIR